MQAFRPNQRRLPVVQAEGEIMKFKQGDKVQWTHEYRQGRSITFTTRKGTIADGRHEKPGCYFVRFRNKIIGVHKSRLRLEGEQSELTDMVISSKETEKSILRPDDGFEPWMKHSRERDA
jgi:hypothetical protein